MNKSWHRKSISRRSKLQVALLTATLMGVFLPTATGCECAPRHPHVRSMRTLR